MRENRTYGFEGGEGAKALYPYRSFLLMDNLG